MAAPFKPTPFKFGYYYDMENDEADKNTILEYGGGRHIVLFGVNGVGKLTRILAENIVTLKGRSLVIIDIKGELAAQTHRTRRTLGDVNRYPPDPGGFGVRIMPLTDLGNRKSP